MSNTINDFSSKEVLSKSSFIPSKLKNAVQGALFAVAALISSVDAVAQEANNAPVVENIDSLKEDKAKAGNEFGVALQLIADDKRSKLLKMSLMGIVSSDADFGFISNSSLVYFNPNSTPITFDLERNTFATSVAVAGDFTTATARIRSLFNLYKDLKMDIELHNATELKDGESAVNYSSFLPFLVYNNENMYIALSTEHEEVYFHIDKFLITNVFDFESKFFKLGLYYNSFQDKGERRVLDTNDFSYGVVFSRLDRVNTFMVKLAM